MSADYDRGLVDGYRQAMTDTMQACEQIIKIASALGHETSLSRAYLQAIDTIKSGCVEAIAVLDEPRTPAAKA